MHKTLNKEEEKFRFVSIIWSGERLVRESKLLPTGWEKINGDFLPSFWSLFTKSGSGRRMILNETCCCYQAWDFYWMKHFAAVRLDIVTEWNLLLLSGLRFLLNETCCFCQAWDLYCMKVVAAVRLEIFTVWKLLLQSGLRSLLNESCCCSQAWDF